MRGLIDLTRQGLLLKYVVASLFRVTWGFALAAILAIPLGLTIGWYRRAEMAFNPLIQFLRPISPLAWIPIAILWFGVGDLAAIFLIFLSCFFPLLLTAINAVRSIPAVYINAGRNFGLSPAALVYRVLYPAVVPQLIVGLRITLGIAWLVVVAAENFLTADDHEQVSAAYGGNAGRLREVKRRFDPDNVFSSAIPLPGITQIGGNS
jgi:NitT/TauT family transport system permease protein